MLALSAKPSAWDLVSLNDVNMPNTGFPSEKYEYSFCQVSARSQKQSSISGLVYSKGTRLQHTEMTPVIELIGRAWWTLSHLLWVQYRRRDGQAFSYPSELKKASRMSFLGPLACRA